MVAKEFITKIICGIPKTILTDQGTNFLSKLFKNVCKLLIIITYNYQNSNNYVPPGE